jgi:hypothetical protein
MLGDESSADLNFFTMVIERVLGTMAGIGDIREKKSESLLVETWVRSV